MSDEMKADFFTAGFLIPVIHLTDQPLH